MSPARPFLQYSTMGRKEVLLFGVDSTSAFLEATCTSSLMACGCSRKCSLIVCPLLQFHPHTANREYDHKSGSSNMVVSLPLLIGQRDMVQDPQVQVIIGLLLEQMVRTCTTMKS